MRWSRERQKAIRFLLRGSRCLYLFMALCLSCGCYSLSRIHEITTDNLRAMLDNQENILIDVRVEREWEAAREKIKGARHEDPFHVNEWAGKYPKDKTIILYCA